MPLEAHNPDVHGYPSHSKGRSRSWVLLTGISLSTIVLAGCVTTGPAQDGAAMEGFRDVQDLYVVDCLLPGQVRRLGGATYLTPRRPIRTTTNDCRIRGGEYVAYDRADYRAALNVWLERAQAGDAKAQNYVGEIFEKGLGQDPDYASAAIWYRRAALQGFARAQINLGYLYENGLGVERDSVTALNWYRRASGLDQDELVFRSEFSDEIDALRSELSRQIDENNRQVTALRNQLNRMRNERDDLQRQLEAAQRSEATATSFAILDTITISAPRAGSEAEQRGAETGAQLEELETNLARARAEIQVLEGLFQRTDEERERLQLQLAQLPQQRSVQVPELQPLDLPAQDPATFAGINFGRYYALIIGNRDYQYLDPLVSPINDAERVRRLLEDRYGFRTIFLPNADKRQILHALNDLYQQLRPEDNLLVYYAGHGNLSERDQGRRQNGYWLPVDAERERLAFWINNAVISDHLDRIPARSVLVLADSCYAGTLASESSALLLGSVQTSLTPDMIKAGLSRRSRVVISSGGVRPVLDTLDGQHSVFASALIDALENNDQVLRENALFARVGVNVRLRSQNVTEPQTPEMRPIRAAGHEGGEFFFVPVASR